MNVVAVCLAISAAITVTASASVSVAVFGRTNVGKTTLCKTLANIPISDNEWATIGAAYFTTALKSPEDGDGEPPIRMNLWDTAGQERFRSLTPIYMTRAKIVLLVYDVSNQESMRQLREMCVQFEGRPKADNKRHIFIGNKADLLAVGDADHNEGECDPIISELRDMFDDPPHFRVSVMTGEGMVEFCTVLYQYMKGAQSEQQRKDNRLVIPDLNVAADGRRCCPF